MKKYFMAGTDDELKYGDIIEVDLSKGKRHEHMECKFHPALVGILLDEDIIEMKDVEEEEEKDNNDTLEFAEDNCKSVEDCKFMEVLDKLIKSQEMQTELISKLSDRVIDIEGVIADMKSPKPKYKK